MYKFIFQNQRKEYNTNDHNWMQLGSAVLFLPTQLGSAVLYLPTQLGFTVLFLPTQLGSAVLFLHTQRMTKFQIFLKPISILDIWKSPKWKEFRRLEVSLRLRYHILDSQPVVKYIHLIYIPSRPVFFFLLWLTILARRENWWIDIGRIYWTMSGIILITMLVGYSLL